MPTGEVDHVDVVANTCAVRCGVIVSKDTYRLKLPDGDLGDIRDKVVGDALRVLSDEAADMCADGVEVTQQYDVLLVVAKVEVGQNLLKHALGLSVRVCCLVLGAIFGDGDELGLAVHRRT